MSRSMDKAIDALISESMMSDKDRQKQQRKNRRSEQKLDFTQIIVKQRTDAAQQSSATTWPQVLKNLKRAGIKKNSKTYKMCVSAMEGSLGSWKDYQKSLRSSSKK